MHKEPKKLIERNSTEFEKFCKELKEKDALPRIKVVDDNTVKVGLRAKGFWVPKQDARSFALADMDQRLHKANTSAKPEIPSKTQEIEENVKKIEQSLVGRNTR